MLSNYWSCLKQNILSEKEQIINLFGFLNTIPTIYHFLADISTMLLGVII